MPPAANCPRCGRPSPANTAYCSGCGATLSSTSSRKGWKLLLGAVALFAGLLWASLIYTQTRHRAARRGVARPRLNRPARDAFTRQNVALYSSSVTDTLEMLRDVRSHIFPKLIRPVLQRQRLYTFRGSHEQNNNALKVYRDVYGLPFRATNLGADGGVGLLNNLMKVDRSHSHPFKRDERAEDGLCRLGYTRFFLLVDDDKAAPPPPKVNPRDLHDSDLARYQLKRWRELPVSDTAKGEVERGPEKRLDDFGNGLMMCTYDGLPVAEPLTDEEEKDLSRPAGLRNADIAAIADHDTAARAHLSQMFCDFDHSEPEVEDDGRFYFET